MRHFGGTFIAAWLTAFLLGVSASAQSPSCDSPHSCAIAAAFEVNVRAVEPDLPDMRLIDWLRQVAGPEAKVATGNWDDSFVSCEGVRSEPKPPADVSVPW